MAGCSARAARSWPGVPPGRAALDRAFLQAAAWPGVPRRRRRAASPVPRPPGCRPGRPPRRPRPPCCAHADPRRRWADECGAPRRTNALPARSWICGGLQKPHRAYKTHHESKIAGDGREGWGWAAVLGWGLGRRWHTWGMVRRSIAGIVAFAVTLTMAVGCGSDDDGAAAPAQPVPSAGSPSVPSTPAEPSPSASPSAPASTAPKPTKKGKLKRGVKGAEVVALQKRLTELGYWNGKADGSFGGADPAGGLRAAEGGRAEARRRGRGQDPKGFGPGGTAEAAQ